MFYSPTSSTLYHHSKALCLRTRTCQAPCCRQAHHTGADDNHSRRTLLALAPPCAKLKDAPFLLKSFDTLHSLPVPRPSQHKQLLVNMWRCMANQNTRLRRLPAKKNPRHHSAPVSAMETPLRILTFGGNSMKQSQNGLECTC